MVFPEMDLKKFFYMTFFGSLIWNFGLAYAGFIMGANWLIIGEIISQFDIFFVFLGLFSGIFIIKYF
jgi:membrane protein DedA with SNARE-associated domain